MYIYTIYIYIYIYILLNCVVTVKWLLNLILHLVNIVAAKLKIVRFPCRVSSFLFFSKSDSRVKNSMVIKKN